MPSRHEFAAAKAIISAFPSTMHLFSFPLHLPLADPLVPASPPLPLRDLRAFLRAHPASAYTALLTTRSRHALPHLSFHAARLARGAAALTSAPAGSLTARRLAAACLAAVAALPDGPAEAELVPFVSDAGPDGRPGQPWLHVYAKVLDAEFRVGVAREPVIVEARGGPRPDPLIKNTAWVMQRSALEEARGKDVRETVLLGQGGEGPVLLEGLVTNFYVVSKSGVLWTAGGDSVLGGSVRDLVMRAATALGVEVVERAPRVAVRADYDAAFVTNAVQVVTPVKTIRFPTLQECEAELVLPCSREAMDLVERLRGAVLNYLADESTIMTFN